VMDLCGFKNLELLKVFNLNLMIDSSRKNLLHPNEIRLPHLKLIDCIYAKPDGSPAEPDCGIRANALVWLLENCPLLRLISTHGSLTNLRGKGKRTATHFNPISMRATVRHLKLKLAFHSDEDLKLLLPYFDLAFRSLKKLDITLVGDRPDLVDRFFIHIFQACKRLKVLSVMSVHFRLSHLKSLEETNLPSQLEATISMNN